MAKLRLSPLLFAVTVLLSGCHAPGPSGGNEERSSSAAESAKSPLLSRLFKAYQDNKLELWREHVAPDATASWNTTQLNGEGFIAALGSAHETYQGITIKNLRVTTVDKTTSRATSFVSLDWSAKVRSNGRQIEVPCQATIQWEGMTIVAWDEVFDHQVVTEALEADGASGSERAVAEKDFDRLKGLSGEWYLTGGVRLGVELGAKPGEAFLSYSVSSGGHAVIEKLFVGQPGEMTTIYYLDEGRLRMDHYCSLGNQPRMVAVPGTGSEIAFQLVSVDNMPDKNDLHISSHSLEFPGPGELTVHWGATKEQEPSLGSMYRVRPLR